MLLDIILVTVDVTLQAFDYGFWLVLLRQMG